MKYKVDLLIINSNQLVTASGNGPKKGHEQSKLNIIENGAVAVKEGIIIDVDNTKEIINRYYVEDNDKIINASSKVVLPGLIDSHTHLIYAGDREIDLENKLLGKPSGGIMNTVIPTRNASEEELLDLANKRINKMVASGTTTVEIKSGYGLSVVDELKTLRVIKKLRNTNEIDIIPTFMGAHAVPDEYSENADGYIKLVIDEMLPLVASEKLAEFCDVFCKKGFFTNKQCEKVLQRAKKLGLKLKVHADEEISVGGAELAAKIKAVSADQLEGVSNEGINRLSKSDSIAVLLPTQTLCGMHTKYAPARQIIDSKIPVVLSTDYNPGSSPVLSLNLVMSIALRVFKMNPSEVINAVTINAAYAIDRGKELGSIEKGKKADIVLYDVNNYQYIPYTFETDIVSKVIKNGNIIY